MEVLYRLSYRGIIRLCGGGRIRTSVGEAGRFTVCSLWPLGHTPGHAPAALCAERPNMVANATDFSTDRKGTAGTSDREPGEGFEPPTGRLQGGCSTSELPGRIGFRRQASGRITATRSLHPFANAILPRQVPERASQARMRSVYFS